MSAPLLAQALAGDIFFAFIAAIAFATILAVVAGLTISASTSFAHDFYTSVIHKGVERAPGEEVRVARITAFVVGAVAIGIPSLPIGFRGAVLGTFLRREPKAETRFAELLVRANTGLGAEKAVTD